MGGQILKILKTGNKGGACAGESTIHHPPSTIHHTRGAHPRTQRSRAYIVRCPILSLRPWPTMFRFCCDRAGWTSVHLGVARGDNNTFALVAAEGGIVRSSECPTRCVATDAEGGVGLAECSAAAGGWSLQK